MLVYSLICTVKNIFYNLRSVYIQKLIGASIFKPLNKRF